ncbi:MAG TPA: DUF72 domain-containing protein [Gemmataceae bacterium]|nr:DUF72 domain-containing protein [Gemmataceae bacterium]
MADRFPADGTHLARYARRFTAVEINSSFYRPHRPATYARWADSVPDDFRFAIKVPKEATHERRLVDTADVLDRFRNEVSHLGDKLGPLLVQLPPSLSFAGDMAAKFFADLRKRFRGAIVIEPRHATWFNATAEQLMVEYCVARVAADPAVVPIAAQPGGWGGIVYYRLHGTPRVYYSAYSSDYLLALCKTTNTQPSNCESTWCIFDNTAAGFAVTNALEFQTLLT